MPAETGLTVKTDIAPEISIDYVNRFSQGIQELQKALGITNLIPVPQGGTIKTYKFVKDVKSGVVAEGDTIPASNIKRQLDQTIELPLNKYRRVTSAEAIQLRGRDRAINEADAQLIGTIQNGIRSDLIASVATTTAAAKNGKTLQAAMANLWASLTGKFEGYDGFDTDAANPFVFFVNPLDVADYLGTATVTTQNAAGITYLKDFLGLGTAITSSKVKAGTIFGTAAMNLNLAYIPANGSDLASTFGLTSDATGFVGITHSTDTKTATCDTLVMSGVKIFPEITDGVIKAEIKATV